MVIMSMTPMIYNRYQTAAIVGAFGWAYLVSDYIRAAFTGSVAENHGRGEALIGFGLWGLLLWWVSRRYSGGWSVYWFAFALATYAPFADLIDSNFGGVLGLSTMDHG